MSICLLLLLLLPNDPPPGQGFEKKGISSNGTFSLTLRFDTDPVPLNQPFGFEIRIERKDSGDLQPISISVDARMPQHRHGMVHQPVISRVSDQVYRVDNMLFHMPGRWELYVDVTQDYVTERLSLEILLE